VPAVRVESKDVVLVVDVVEAVEAVEVVDVVDDSVLACRRAFPPPLMASMRSR
jgi:hypothetical protein